jgi:hypothetical protein
MPTIRRLFGLRVVIYTHDHRPAHVHIVGNGHEAVFNLHCPGGPPELRENYGFSRRMLERVADALMSDLVTCCNEWSRIHGDY